MAKEDGGIIILDDDDDDDDGEELKTGSWVARPWKLPSSSHTSSVTGVQLQPSPSTLTGPSQTSHSTSNAQPQAPPSTSKSRPQTQHSNSLCLPASQINGSNVLHLPNKEVMQSSLKSTNENFFKEFMDFCANETSEHPEVMSFLQGRYQKASPAFLSSTEFRNIIGRCLARVQNKKNKVYVYINELCTVLKSNSEKKKVALSSAPISSVKLKRLQSEHQVDSSADEPAASAAEEENQEAEEEADNDNVANEKEEHRPVSKKQIRYLENLLSLYTTEIRKLQEKELDLTQLDDEDSIYIQENRLKRKMIRVFEKLCELKSCCSRTGRVIEQRIPYRGTRYPEVNRHIQKFINKPDNFPDYGDILKVIEKANIRHNLSLSKRQMQSMATDAFRDVGNRLQERRHLDMVYNFGSHLTDKYKAGTDPALMDPALARRLRDNRTVALSQLDEVVKKYAVMQDDGEEELDRRRRRTAATHNPKRGAKVSTLFVDEESDEDNEEEEEDESSDTDIEEELQKCEELSEPEEDVPEEESAPDITDSDQRMDNRSEPSQFSSAGEEAEDDDDDDDDEDDVEDEEEDSSVKNGEGLTEPEDDPRAVAKSHSLKGSGQENHDKPSGFEIDSAAILKKDTFFNTFGKKQDLVQEQNSISKQHCKSINVPQNNEDSLVFKKNSKDVFQESTGSSVFETIKNEDSMINEINLDARKKSVPSKYMKSKSPIDEKLAHEIKPMFLKLSTMKTQVTDVDSLDLPLQPIVPTSSLLELQMSSKTEGSPQAPDRFQTSFEIFCGSSLEATGSLPASLSSRSTDLETEAETLEYDGSLLSPSDQTALPSTLLPSSLSTISQKAVPTSKYDASEMVHQKPASPEVSCELQPASSPVASRSRLPSPDSTKVGLSALISQKTSKSPLPSSTPCKHPSQRSFRKQDASQMSSSTLIQLPTSELSVSCTPSNSDTFSKSSHFLVASPRLSESPEAAQSEASSPDHAGSQVAFPQSSSSLSGQAGSPFSAVPRSLTQSPKPSVSPTPSQQHGISSNTSSKSPGLHCTSPKHPPMSVCIRSLELSSSLAGSPMHTESKTLSRNCGSQTASPRPCSQTASPQAIESPTASTHPIVSLTTSPRPVSPMPSGASPPNYTGSRAVSPLSSQSSLSASGSLAASPVHSYSPAVSPGPTKTLTRSVVSRFKSDSSHLGESKLGLRTNSSASSNISVDGKKEDTSYLSLNSHGSVITAAVSLPTVKDLRLSGDEHLSGISKVTNSGLCGTLKTSNDDCVLIDETGSSHNVILPLKDVFTESIDLNEATSLPAKQSLSTCVTRVNVKSETPSVTPVRRKRTLSGTVRRLQSKRDAASQENGTKSCMESINGSPGDSFHQSNHPSKKARRDESYFNSSAAEVHSINSDSGDDETNLSMDLHVTCVTSDSPVPLADSTQDSPFLSLVSSSPYVSKQQHKSTKVNAATQCDPEEVIVLSDSD